ncbi:MAG TPA: histidine kinase dimerization/phospho-acceptor domain-containing protein [Allosphingosinicella sp.]|nr:histidine kinase dimerization/phospho-acceptor domain-containing protein [Allosphingosinicella sp.]
MRFDDRIATALAWQAEGPDGRTAQWRQLVDLLAQGPADAADADRGRAFDLLRAERGAVDPAVRRQAARALAGRAAAPDLIAFFAEDSPSIAAPLIAQVRLERAAWLALLPRLGPAARALLRHREDLDLEVRHALSAFGPSDLVLEMGPEAAASAAAVPAEAQSDSQIRELVARIEAFRRQRASQPPAAPFLPDARAENFRWETGTDGILIWVEGAPRAPLIGQSIAAIAGRGQHGVDGQAAGAFEKRAPFRDARLGVAGSGPASGDWRISGVPYFDPQRGGFLGYRGTARRPRVDEIAYNLTRPAGVFGTQFPADSLRQLIHELRTPLNAIIGFAEMIEGQYMGPAAAGYRGSAAEIVAQARGLLGAVDDLDTAARLETRRFEAEDSQVDAVALLCRLHESYERVAAERGAHIAIEIAEGLPPASVEPAAAERMYARLLAGTIGLAGEGEAIRAALTLAPRGEAATLCLAVGRPAAIHGVEEADLLDPGYSPEGDWPGAPALGLGFALRLIRNLAEAVGGALVVEEARFALYLPVPAAAAAAPDGNASQG